MTGSAGGSDRPARWGTAACLVLAVVLLSALQSLPLVLVPLALVLLAYPGEPRWRSLVAAVAFGLFGLSLTVEPLGGVSRAWALLAGGAFLLCSTWRPAWGVFTRALVAIGAAGAVAAGWLASTGVWSSLDEAVRGELAAMAERTLAAAREGAPESAWLQELASAAGQVAELQADLFPALVALQTLAALALAAWLVTSLRGGETERFRVRPWREFRFNDQLVWLLIAGLGLVMLPLGDVAGRVGLNAIVFMAALYALRGVGVFLFLSVGATSLLMIVFGTLAAIFLYPLTLGAAILIGLGDTWLDVRGRAVAAPRP